MRSVHGGFALLFLVAAALQWNDPDPWRWIVLYAAAGVAAVLAYRRLYEPLLLGALIGACLTWMSFLGDSMLAFWRRGEWSLLAATMKAGEPLIEESREFLGLAIVLLWCLLTLAARALRRR
jgi:Transmembrane family 220, helix